MKNQEAKNSKALDTINRQAAIDALKNRWKKTRNYEGNGDDIAEECELYLEQVPSANTPTNTPTDCISRKAAIDAVDELLQIATHEEKHKLSMLRRVLKDALPSAQPSPCEFCRHNNIADDKACLMCSAERKTDE